MMSLRGPWSMNPWRQGFFYIDCCEITVILSTTRSLRDKNLIPLFAESVNSYFGNVAKISRGVARNRSYFVSQPATDNGVKDTSCN